MGWLRKIGRKIDKGIRKVFGKNGWLKAAATVAALTFAAPIFGTGTMSFSKAGAGVGAIPTVTVNPVPAAHTRGRPPATAWTSFTDATKEYFRKKGTQIKELPQTIVEQGQTLVGETADKAVKAEIIERAMGDEQFEGSTKGVQEVASSETALVQDALTYSFNNPQDMPSLSVTLADPVFAKWSNITS